MDSSSSQDVNNEGNNADFVLKGEMNGGENGVGKEQTTVEQDDEDLPPPLQDVDTNNGPVNENTSNLRAKKEKVASEDGWIDILENGQLLKKVLKEGDDSSYRPERTWKVTLSLKTSLKETGEQVPSETFDEITAFVGDYDVIHGVDLTLPLMKVGEVAEVVIHPRFAYGEKGKEPEIPANATLSCEIHLIAAEMPDDQLPISDKLKFGFSKKERGNFWFSLGDYSSAIHCYRRAIEFLDPQSEDEISLNDLKMNADVDISDENHQNVLLLKQLLDTRCIAFNNLAAAQLKTGALNQALQAVNSSLLIDERNVKALFRKGKILKENGQVAEALEVLKAALAIAPDSNNIKREIKDLAIKRKQEVVDEKKLYMKMLNVNPRKSEPSSQETPGLGMKWPIIVFSIAAAFAGTIIAVKSF